MALDEDEEVAVKFDPKYWQAFEYEKRLELSLTEKERADAVSLIISMFKQRLQNTGREQNG